MYKILIVSSTDYILRHKEKFSALGFSCDYLICERQSEYNFGQFDQQHICADQQMLPVLNNTISIESVFATQKKIKTRQHIYHELDRLKKIIFKDESKINHISKFKLAHEAVNSDQVFSLDDCLDLQFNLKHKKIHLEIKNNEVSDYDHVYFEHTNMAFDLFRKKFPDQQFIKSTNSPFFQFAGLTYQANVNLTENPFWLMSDVNYKSLYDNVHFLNPDFKKNSSRIDIWSWVPYQQLKNPEMYSYMQQRVQKRFEACFDFLILSPVTERNNFIFQPVNTLIYSKNPQENLISWLPSFHFYSEQQVEYKINSISDETLKKLKIKKENLEVIQNQETV